jgi:hypothetical protein
MKLTLKALPITLLCAFLVCGAASAQVQPSSNGPLHSRFGLPLPGPEAQQTGLANREVPSGSPAALSFTFGTIDYPNGPQTVAQAINKNGEIVGSWGPDPLEFVSRTCVVC